MVNSIITQLQPPAILEYNALFSKIEGIHLLTLGAPDFDVPDFVKEAGKKAIDDGLNGYGPGIGLPALRQAYVDFLKRKYQLDYTPNDIITTCGLSQALPAVLKGLLNAGDKVIIPTPSFPQYETTTLINGGVPIFVDTSKDNFIFTAQALQQVATEHSNIKALIINYPSNPTGVTYTSKQLQELAEVAKTLNIIVISDEIYSELIYDKKHDSIARYLPEQSILLNGMSKTYAMTGWRVGFIATQSKALHQAILIAHQDSIPVSPIFTQVGAIAALNDGDSAIEEMKNAYKERRDYLVKELSELGFEITSPDGAFYLFPRIPRVLNMDDVTFVKELAQQAKVGIIPGDVFGPGGKYHVRISYAASLDVLKECVARIKTFMSQY